MNSTTALRRARPVISSESAQASSSSPAALRGWQIIFAAGAALAVIGWTDVGLLWIPLQFGVPEWEFGVIAQSLQAMPLGTLGLVLLTAGAAARERRTVLAGLAPLFILIVAGVLGLLAMFALASIQGLGAVGPEMQQAMEKAILKTSVLAVTYSLFYAWLSVISIRFARRKGSISV